MQSIHALDGGSGSPLSLMPASFTGVSTGLPDPLTSFVDRELEVAQLVALLSRDDVRLVTLTGPGGVGKTRLALKVTAHFVGEPDTHVIFVSLATLENPLLFGPTIGQAFGFKDSGNIQLGDRIASALSSERTLLLLDNLEHIVDSTPLLAQILSSCPSLKILVTSRVVLRISGEREFVVSPLALPALDIDATAIERTPAVQLFLERSNLDAAHPTTSTSEIETVAAICQRLDGLPLAIELAAAKSRLLTPAQLLSRLDRRLPLLTGGYRDVPARLQTMRDAIAWSYALLTENEKTLFRALTVFAGGFSLAAAEFVGATFSVNQDASATASVFDTLESLVRHSLVSQTVVNGGVVRFFMLETIREFGLDCLSELDETTAVQSAHMDWFISQVDIGRLEALDGYLGASAPSLAHDQDNLRAAKSFALDQGNISAAIHMAAGLAPFWWEYGHYGEARSALNQILARNGAVADQSSALVTGWAAEWAWLQADYASTQEFATRALELSRQLRYAPGVAANLYRLGRVATLMNSASAIQLLEAALAEGKLLGDDRIVFWSLLGLARASINAGANDHAAACLTDAGRLIDQLDDPEGAWLSLSLKQSEGQLALNTGNLERAFKLLDESLISSREHRNRFCESYALLLLGQVAFEQGYLNRAVTDTTEALVRVRQLGNLHRECQCLGQLASVAFAAGEFGRTTRFLGYETLLRERVGIANFPYTISQRRPTREMLMTALGVHEYRESLLYGRSLTATEVLQEARSLELLLAESSLTRSILTDREMAVLELIVNGKSNREIAEILFISESTTESHVASILRILDASSRKEAVSRAQNLGLCSPDRSTRQLDRSPQKPDAAVN